jgi:hypothetical protein
MIYIYIYQYCFYISTMLFRPGFPIGGGIGGLTFIYAVPVMLLGAALLYAELLPVEAGSQDTQEMEDFGD